MSSLYHFMLLHICGNMFCHTYHINCDHSKLISSSLSPCGYFVPHLKKFPQGVLEISRLQEWNVATSGQPKNIMPPTAAIANLEDKNITLWEWGAAFEWKANKAPRGAAADHSMYRHVADHPFCQKGGRGYNNSALSRRPCRMNRLRA